MKETSVLLFSAVHLSSKSAANLDLNKAALVTSKMMKGEVILSIFSVLY